MSVASGLEYSYNTACPECGLAGWEHREGCSYDCPADQPSTVDRIEQTTVADMVAAVDRNAERIRSYGGEYGVPANGDDTEDHT